MKKNELKYIFNIYVIIISNNNSSVLHNIYKDFAKQKLDPILRKIFGIYLIHYIYMYTYRYIKYIYIYI